MTNQWNAAVTPRMASSPSSPCCRAGSPSSWWASQQSRICTQFQIDLICDSSDLYFSIMHPAIRETRERRSLQVQRLS